MERYVGLDVSVEETAICVIDVAGRVHWRGTCESMPEAIAATLGEHAPDACRIGLETGPLATWHWHALCRLGLLVICLDARHARAALSPQITKTDGNDAYGLKRIVWTEWCREVKVKSLESHLVRSLLAARSLLVKIRTGLMNRIRGILKTFGIRLGAVRSQAFIAQARRAVSDQPALTAVIIPLLRALQAITDQMVALDRRALVQARGNSACHRPMTVPAIGPVTALIFRATLDDPRRFARSSSVGALLGLTPRPYQSGEIDRTGRISKCGDGMSRHYLFEAAGVLLTHVGRWSRLKAWDTRLAMRVGPRKAKVAGVRKPAVVGRRIWRDGSTFRGLDTEVAV